MGAGNTTGSSSGGGARTPVRRPWLAPAPRGPATGAGPAPRTEFVKNWFSAVAIVVSAVGLFVPLWLSEQTAKQNADAASYTQRAELYRGYLGSASAFDIAAAHFICLSRGKTPSTGDTASAFKDLTDSYTSLSKTAWNIEFAAASTSGDLKGELRDAKDAIAREADNLYGSISTGHAAELSPAGIDSAIAGLQNKFAAIARSDLDGTALQTPKGAPPGTLGCTG